MFSIDIMCEFMFAKYTHREHMVASVLLSFHCLPLAIDNTNSNHLG